MLAMEHGKHVICEKPMEIRLDLIDKMIAVTAEDRPEIGDDLSKPLFRCDPRDQDCRRAKGRFGRVAWAGVSRRGIAPTNITPTPTGAAPGTRRRRHDHEPVGA